MALDKQTKYDRQLRLWSQNGQSALEHAHICLINATSTGCETLKNLILPGIGKFTIIDDSTVTLNDISSNFFLGEEDLGKLKGPIVTKLLNELNLDVQGNYISQSVYSLLSSNIWSQFSLVITSSISTSTLESLSDLLFHQNIPIISLQTIGFYGSIRIIQKEHYIIETHPDSLSSDLRLNDPWPELLDYVNSVDLNEIDEVDRAHVPYIVLLLKKRQKYIDKKINNKTGTGTEIENGTGIKSGTETNITNEEILLTRDDIDNIKKELKSEIKSIDEDNFNEAITYTWKLRENTKAPSEIQSLINDKALTNISRDSNPFWILLYTLKQYLDLPEVKNTLPLTGVLPDMKADTKSYIKVQTIYRNKALKEKLLFRQVFHNLIQEIGGTSYEFPDPLIDLFCANSKYIKIQRGSAERLSKSFKLRLNDHISNPDSNPDSLIYLYIALLIFTTFKDYNASSPGKYQSMSSLTNIDEVKDISLELLNELNISKIDLQLENYLKEIVRSNGSEIHNIASLIGGMASQEALKLVTSQYVPLDNLLVFDGIFSKTETWKI